MIHWIVSPDDPRLEPYRHVGDPLWISRHHLFVAEGRFVVERLLALGSHDVQSILVNRAAHDALIAQLSAADTAVLVCEDPTLASITGYNFHRGCLALVARPRPLTLDDVAAARRLLAVESVSNPDNVGGLFRTAAAFGVEAVLLDESSGDPLYRKALRTSMGAALRLPYVRVKEWLPALEGLRGRGYRIVALTPRPAATTLQEFAATAAPGEPLVVLVGSEGDGLEAASLSLADARVRIPIDDAVDSLNVVVAAGVALAQLR